MSRILIREPFPSPREAVVARLNRFFEPSPSASRVPLFDGLRGVAALMVFWFHFGSLFSGYAANLAPFAFGPRSLGLTGLDIFFLLTGYLVYSMALRKESSCVEFLSRRVRRIYPAFAAVFALYLALNLALAVLVPQQPSRVPSGWLSGASYLVANLLLLPGVFAIQPLITVSWSLSYQVLVYASFPILVWRLRMNRWSPDFRVLFWIGWAALTILLPSPLLMFGAGPVVYELSRSRLFEVRRPGFALPLSAFLILLPLLGNFVGGIGPAAPVSRFAGYTLLVTVLLTGSGYRLQRILGWAPLRWLGCMSLSFYLAHGLTLVAFRFCLRSLDISPSPLAVIGVCLPLSLPLALASSLTLFRLVERPFSIARQPKPALQPMVEMEPARAAA